MPAQTRRKSVFFASKRFAHAGVEHDDFAALSRLGLQQGDFGVLDDRFAVVAVIGKDGDAAAQPERQRRAVTPEHASWSVR